MRNFSANVAAVITLLVVTVLVYLILHFVARGPLVEGAAIIIGFVAAVVVKNSITKRIDSNEE